MRMTLAAVAAVAGPLVLTAAAAPAVAAPTESAPLTCDGSTSVEVTGFGRGQVLQVVGSNSVFVVTFAQLKDSGAVVFNNPGLATGASIVECTATSPVGAKRPFVFRGFFTPRG